MERENLLKIIYCLRDAGCNYYLDSYTENEDGDPELMEFHHVILDSDVQVTLMLRNNISSLFITKTFDELRKIIYDKTETSFFRVRNIKKNGNVLEFDGILEFQHLFDKKYFLNIKRLTFGKEDQELNTERFSAECDLDFTFDLYRYTNDENLLNYFSENEFAKISKRIPEVQFVDFEIETI